MTTGGRGEDMLLREYVDSLGGVAKSRYFDKLKALGLAATDDPYVSGDFQKAMQLWPPVEFGHMFCYFIERPGVYTRRTPSKACFRLSLQWSSICSCTDLSDQWVWFPLEKARKISSNVSVGSIYIHSYSKNHLP